MTVTTAQTTTTRITGAPHEVFTIDAARRLPATVDVETAGAFLGIGRSKSYQLAKAGDFPVRVLRIGRCYKVPTNVLLNLLGIDVPGDGPAHS